MKFAYYPGCVIPASGKEYDMSTKEVFKALDLELVELEDWNCCGASAIYSLDHLLSLVLPARNLAIAEKQKLDIATPCPECYYRLWKVNDSMKEDLTLMEKVNKAFNGTSLKYKGGVEVKHIAEILVNDIDIDKLSEKIVKPLDGLKVVPYYGCILVKPPRNKRLDSPENPMLLDNIVTLLGAENISWDAKTTCCGGPLMLQGEDIMYKLSYNLLTKAKGMGGDCIITPCPQCNMALDAKQKGIEGAYNKKIEMPVLYFTQLVGLALGISPKRLGMDKNLTPTKGVLEKIGL